MVPGPERPSAVVEAAEEHTESVAREKPYPMYLRIAEFIPLTPQAIRKVGHRYVAGGFERAVYKKERPGAAALLEDS
jgi:hypothetical protein